MENLQVRYITCKILISNWLIIILNEHNERNLRSNILWSNYWSLMIVSSVLTSAIPCMAFVKTVASFRERTCNTCGVSLPELWIIIEWVVIPLGVTVKVSMLSLFGSTWKVGHIFVKNFLSSRQYQICIIHISV